MKNGTKPHYCEVFFSEIKNEVYGLCKKPANKGVVTF